MKRKTKTMLAVSGGILLVLVVVALFVPLVESGSWYCFYCGREALEFRVLKVPVWRSDSRRSIYRDALEIPEHAHRMIDHGGSRMWVFHGTEHRDEFGWTGTPCREALVRGLKAFPDRRMQLLDEFMSLDPANSEARAGFIKACQVAAPALTPR